MNRIALALAACLLAGCSGQVSTSPEVGNVVYPISADEADRVIGQAMLAAFPEEPIAPVTLPNRGYSSTIRFALDSHRVTATAIPGDNGYSFRVTHAGTMPISGSNRSAAIFADVNHRAAAISSIAAK